MGKHGHSTYSALDGAAKIDDLVAAAKAFGMPALALTDHGTVSGLPDFARACDREGVKPIFSMEGYLVDSVERVKREKDQRRYHQVVHAMTGEGLANLFKLASWAGTDGFYYKPLMDFAALEKYSEGLIVTSSCVNGIIHKAIVEAWREPAFEPKVHDLIKWFLRVFGDRFYAEVHNHGLDDERVVRDAWKVLAPKYGIRVICAGDCHYITPEDHRLQKALVSIGVGKDYWTGGEYAHEGLHFHSPREMEETFHAEFPTALEETCRMAERMTAKMPFGRHWQLPDFPVPAGMGTELDYLYRICAAQLGPKYPGQFSEAKSRLDYEIGVIKQLGLARYFLIVQDMLNWARSQGIAVGPGRGSAAGSIVAYLAGITNIDPIRYDLLFERFLNPERVSLASAPHTSTSSPLSAPCPDVSRETTKGTRAVRPRFATRLGSTPTCRARRTTRHDERLYCRHR